MFLLKHCLALAGGTLTLVATLGAVRPAASGAPVGASRVVALTEAVGTFPTDSLTHVHVEGIGREPVRFTVVVRGGTVHAIGTGEGAPPAGGMPRTAPDSTPDAARAVGLDTALVARTPTTLVLAPGVHWLRIETADPRQAVRLRLARPGVMPGVPEPALLEPWGRVVTLRRADGRWVPEATFGPAEPAAGQ